MEKNIIENLDDLDIELLKILSEGKVSNALSRDEDTKKITFSLRTIAETLEKSPVTIKKHIEDLENSGIIKNFGITVDYEKLGYDIIALIELTISKGKMLEVEQDIAKHPNIFAVYDITGEYDAMLLARFKSRSELSELVKQINKYEYIIRTNTHLILNVVKEGTEFANLIDHNKD